MQGWGKDNRNLSIALMLVAGLTIMISVWTWPSAPHLQDYGEANPGNDQYRPGGKNCQPSALATVRGDRERAGQTNACKKEAEEYRQNTADLIQQTRSADASEALTDIATQELWTGWLQTLGGFLTLAAAVGAAIYARDAAKHTRDANFISDRNSRTALRAYFIPHGITIALRTLDGCKYVDLRVEWKNFRQTPTKNLIFCTWHAWDKIPETTDILFTKDSVKTIVAPSMGIWGNPITLSLEEVDKIWNGQRAFYIVGHADYNDIMGPEIHSTKHCWKIDFERDNEKPLEGDNISGALWTVIGPYNDAT
jgi:hypothetical protein